MTSRCGACPESIAVQPKHDLYTFIGLTPKSCSPSCKFQAVDHAPGGARTFSDAYTIRGKMLRVCPVIAYHPGTVRARHLGNGGRKGAVIVYVSANTARACHLAACDS